jgi:hypothetical protein
VDAIVAYGYDEVKLDGCSMERNVSLYYDLLNHTASSPVLIENCHVRPCPPHCRDPNPGRC